MPPQYAGPSGPLPRRALEQGGNHRSKRRFLAASALCAATTFGVLAAFAGQAGATSAYSLSFASPSSATAFVGVPFTFDPYARLSPTPQDGAPLYDVSGTLPAGITYSPLVGIAGTPAPGSEGTYQLTWYAAEVGVPSAKMSFTLTVTDSAGPSPVVPLTPLPVQAPQVRVPTKVSWASSADRNSLDNDSLGDCVEAAEAHLADDQAAAVGLHSTVGVDDVLAAYYQLTDGAAGREIGTNNWQAFALWQENGLGDSRLASVSQLADPHSERQVEAAIDELGGVLAYVNVPKNDSPTAGGAPRVWSVSTLSSTAASPTEAHEVTVVGYNQLGPLISTWGVIQQATWSWWQRYARAVYPVITRALVEAGHGPTGIPVSTLLNEWGGTERSLLNASAPPVAA